MDVAIPWERASVESLRNWECARQISKSSQHGEPSVRHPPCFESPPATQPGTQENIFHVSLIITRFGQIHINQTKNTNKCCWRQALTCISFSPYLDGFLLPWLFLRSFFSSPWHFSRLSPLLLCSTWYFLRAACVEGGAECTVSHWCTWRSWRWKAGGLQAAAPPTSQPNMTSCSGAETDAEQRSSGLIYIYIYSYKVI